HVSPGVAQCGAGQCTNVTDPLGQSGGVEQGLAVTDVPGLPLRVAPGDEQLEAARIVGVGAAGVEEFQRVAVVVGGFVVGQLGEGVVNGPGGVVHRPVGFGGGGGGPGPVVGERREAVVGAG